MVREGYKETEIGEIPEEWDIALGSDVFQIGSGGSAEILFDDEGDCLFLKVEDFNTSTNKFGIKTSKQKFFRGASSTRVFPGNSIVFPKRGAAIFLNRVLIVQSTFTVDPNIMVLMPCDRVNTYFLKSLLKLIGLFSICDNSGLPQINNKHIYPLLFALPPLPEQRRIAAVLSIIDEAIEKTEALIDKLRQVNAGLMQDLLTKGIDEEGRVRSEETHAFKDSEIGRVPAEWEVGNVSDHCCVILSNVDKKTHPKEIPVFLCNYLDVFNNDYITLDIRFMKASATTSEIQKYSISKNDVLITKDSETAEEIAITTAVLEDRGTVLCGYHLAIIRPKPDIFNGIFLSKSLNLAPIHRQFVRGAKGVTRYGLNKSEIENAIIPLPPLPEQHRIAAVLTAADDRIAREEAYRDKLLAMKKGLMADLLTGRVRVPESIGACAVRCEQPEGRV